MLDSRYFGIPTRRRRLFLVAGLGQMPPMDFMADAGSMARHSGKGAEDTQWADAHPTLLAGLNNKGSTVDLSLSNVVAQASGWSAMVERQRASENHGFLRGLDETNAEEARAAGNAVCPQVAQWIADKLIKTF